MFGCLAAVVAGMSPALKAADAPESGAVTKLLAEAKKQSYVVSVDAGLLQSYTRSNLDWRTHARQIERMKNHINAAAKTVTALNEARAEAAPWQVAAIDRILPYMREIADDTTKAIEYINKNQSRLKDKDYKDYLAANSDMSQELAKLVAQFVDYGNSKGNNERLQKQLELPAK
jgi:hypothetical protein